MDTETAKYIATYFSQLLTVKEKLAIKHAHSIIKLDTDDESTNRYKIYLKVGWLSGDKDVQELLKDGYDNFEIKVASRILNEHEDKVFLNYCPKCKKLARTPFAKQCRYCGNDWHEK